MFLSFPRTLYQPRTLLNEKHSLFMDRIEFDSIRLKHTFFFLPSGNHVVRIVHVFSVHNNADRDIIEVLNYPLCFR